jgi:tRNA (cytidine/uridine-2'-O-)-methyltransferase
MPKIVLVEPQIPPNTGNIARTCAATQTELHLVGPLGFEISDRHLKRAGLDYWPHVKLEYHQDFNKFQTYHQKIGGRLLGFSVAGHLTYTECQYKDNDWLIFGSETFGLSATILGLCDLTLSIPMTQPEVRSLNLSVSVAVGLFEAYRQLRT